MDKYDVECINHIFKLCPVYSNIPADVVFDEWKNTQEYVALKVGVVYSELMDKVMRKSK